MVREAKNIIITGASSGIGTELAKMAASKGDYPILLARSYSKLKDLQTQLLQQYSCYSAIYQVDVADEGKVAAVVNEIEQHFHRIDVVINNAGVGTFATVENIRSEDARAMVDVNILGTFYITQAVLPHMKKQHAGHIINIGSQAGRLATPKSSMYAAAKHALIGFSNAVRLESSAFSIHVSTVNPGPVRTPFIKKADPSGNYEKAVEKFFIEPSKLAERILGLIEHPRRELNLPWWMAAVSKIYAIMPTILEKLAGKQFKKK
ncbi:SDR family NAD(P)-dependent oxidoreductase [Salibacterium salarium]|nr:SDR family oxidoreductase [Salibacterium salarium]